MIDLSFFLDPPERTVRGVLTIEALAPLSMVSAQPGSYYRSSPAPTDVMLYGLLENALGWHLDAATRKTLFKTLQKQAKQIHGKSGWKDSAWLSTTPTGSDSGYVPLLGFHLAFDGTRDLPAVTSYDDLWARQAHRDDDKNFVGGSRHYDSSLEDVVTRLKDDGDLAFGTLSSDITTLEQIDAGVPDKSSVWPKALKPRFPYYFVSPTPREYVIPHEPYRFVATATPAVAEQIAAALDDPSSPLYLGSNDGWVEASWTVL
jgi:CRISPR-associated protein Cas5